MSCGEPTSWSDQFKWPGLSNKIELEPSYTFYGTADEMKQQLKFHEQLELAYTPLDELPKLSDIEYFQRNMLKGLSIPESYMLNGAVPLSKEHIADQQYLDQQIANNSVPVLINNMEQFDSYFGQPVPGSMFLDTATGDDLDTIGQLFAYDGNDWGLVKEFDLFTVEMVSDPLCFGATIQLSAEEKYDNAMNGVGQ